MRRVEFPNTWFLYIYTYKIVISLDLVLSKNREEALKLARLEHQKLDLTAINYCLLPCEMIRLYVFKFRQG